MKTELNYVKRCKHRSGNELHKTVHAVISDADETVCGHTLNDMWYWLPVSEMSPEMVTCKKCLNKIGD